MDPHACCGLVSHGVHHREGLPATMPFVFRFLSGFRYKASDRHIIILNYDVKTRVK